MVENCKTKHKILEAYNFDSDIFYSSFAFKIPGLYLDF